MVLISRKLISKDCVMQAHTQFPPGLLSVRQQSDSALGGIVLQNVAGNNMSFWVDADKTRHITRDANTAIAIKQDGNVYFPLGNVGMGTITPVQKCTVHQRRSRRL